MGAGMIGLFMDFYRSELWILYQNQCYGLVSKLWILEACGWTFGVRFGVEILQL